MLTCTEPNEENLAWQSKFITTVVVLINSDALGLAISLKESLFMLSLLVVHPSDVQGKSLSA